MRNLFFVFRILEIIKRTFGPFLFWLGVFIAFCLGLLWAASVVSADEIIETDNDFDAQITLNASRQYGFPFTPSVTGTVTEAEVCITNDATDVVVSITDKVGDDPGTPLGSGTIAGPTTSGVRHTVVFDTPVEVDLGVPYFLHTQGNATDPQICGNGGGGGARYDDGAGYDPTAARQNIYFVIETEGGEEPPGAATTTTSVSTASQEAYNGFVLFFMAMFLTIFIFKKR